jgi:hypothetical protein
VGRAWPRHDHLGRPLNSVVSLHVEAAFLSTDHWVDAVFSLESSVQFADRVESDPLWWKWLIVSSHATVQGFMVLALERGNSLAVMKPHIAKAWLEAYRSGTPLPDEKMDFFLELYEKVKDSTVPGYIGSKPFRPGTTHDESMRKLNDLRNDFIHFMPKGWLVQFAGLPQLTRDCAEIAEFLAWDSGHVLWHDAELSDRAKAAFVTLRGQLDQLEQRYAREG